MVKKIFKLDNSGLTLVELIVTMGVGSIILTLILGIFISGIKLNKDIHDSIEIQQQAHFIMDFIEGIIRTSNKVDAISDFHDISFYKSNEEVKLGVVKLKDKYLEDNERHIFSIQKDPKIEGKSIRYGKNRVAKTELGNYIDTIYMKALPEGSSFEDSKGVKITIKMKKGKSNISISKKIYFRRY